jgi:indolepyruvate ferredoxin oxidoreductase
MARNTVKLDDKFDLSKEHVLLSGTQAIVRLALAQKERDRRAGLNTAGFISGYRGSPLGGLDQQFWRAKKVLGPEDIVFQPGLNEDLAATAVWGSQQAEIRGEGRFQGVFGLWYGKGPGVDRTGDVFRHANFDGTSPHGGVLALMGDDHTCESSTTAHQSEFAFLDAMMPISTRRAYRKSWITADRLGAVALFGPVDRAQMHQGFHRIHCRGGRLDRSGEARPPRVQHAPRRTQHPSGPACAREGELLHRWKRPAALAFIRENRLDKMMIRGGSRARLGIVSLGKSWLDTLSALDLLGIDEKRAGDLGLRLYKVAAPWPLEPEGVKRFADGLETISSWKKSAHWSRRRSRSSSMAALMRPQ